MKQNLFVALLCLALLLPSCPVWAQETAAAEQPVAGQPAAETGAAPAKGQTISIGGHSLAWWVNRAIATISQIGAIFGKATGIRIGGTTGTALVTLAAAKLLQNKAPGWLKWLLYLSGGTMAAGGSANILQLLTRQLGS